MFVPHDDAELRSLLAACQAADDPVGPMEVLARFLDRHRDSRGNMVRLGARYWQFTRVPATRRSDAEIEELQRQMEDEGNAVLDDWLGYRGDGDTVGIGWDRVLLYVSIKECRKLPEPALVVLRAGWVWQLDVLCPQVDEVLEALVADPAPIREIAFFGNQSLRDGDLEALVGIPHLHEVDISQTRISDRGLRHLHGIRTLRLVVMEYTPRVTDAGVAALQEALPACAVHRW
jgi:hypothetical protein